MEKDNHIRVEDERKPDNVYTNNRPDLHNKFPKKGITGITRNLIEDDSEPDNYEHTSMFYNPKNDINKIESKPNVTKSSTTQEKGHSQHGLGLNNLKNSLENQFLSSLTKMKNEFEMINLKIDNVEKKFVDSKQRIISKFHLLNKKNSKTKEDIIKRNEMRLINTNLNNSLSKQERELRDNPTISLWKQTLKELDLGNLNKAFSLVLKSGIILNSTSL